MMTLRKNTCIILLALLLNACGGGGDSTTRNAIEPPLVITDPGQVPIPASNFGIYDVDFGNFKGIYTFLDDGRFSGFHYGISVSVFLGHPHAILRPNLSVTDYQSIVWVNYVSALQGEFEREAFFGRTLNNGTMEILLRSLTMGDLYASSSRQKNYSVSSAKTLYFDPIPLNVLAGNYIGELRSAGIRTVAQYLGDFILAENGSFTLTSANCSFKGNMTPYKNTGVFDVQAQTSGAACEYKDVLKGIATPISFVDNKAVLAFQLDTPDATQSTVFVIQKNR